MEETKQIDYIYSEYVRLSNRCDQFMDGTFSDFTLLGFALPVLLGTGTFLGVDSGGDGLPEKISHAASFATFIMVLIVLAIIAFRNLMKFYWIIYYFRLIRDYETILAGHIDPGKTTFRNVNVWLCEFSASYARLFAIFNLLFVIPVIVLPTIILKTTTEYWVGYLVASIIIFSINMIANIFYVKKPMETLLRETLKASK